MRYIFFIFTAVFIFSCNSGDNNSKDGTETKTGTAQSDSASQEIVLKAAHQQYPDSIPILQNLVGFYISGEKYDAAANTIDAAVKRDSLNPALWDIRSVIYLLKTDTASGVASLERAVDIYPTPEYVISLGALYAQIKNAKALDMADALLVGNKANAAREAYFIKGLYYNSINQKEKAIGFFDQSIATDFQFMDAYVQKGLALYDLGKYDEEIKVLQKAVTLQNNFAEGYFHMGQAYEKLNKKAEAAEQYKKALLYDPGYDEAGEALAALKQ